MDTGKSESDMVKRVFSVLQQFSKQKDWIWQVREDLSASDISLSDVEIAAMSKYKFKRLVDTKIKEKAATYLAPN